MFEIQGNYATAKVFAQTVDESAIDQITLLCSQKFAENAKIRIMPDVHAGKGCTIGFTANLGKYVVPNLIGVDIGCGMLCVELGKIELDFEVFDEVIHKFIPSGKEVHEGRITKFSKLQEMHCYRYIKDAKRVERSIGTLGGGNHFIEVDKDGEDNLYLVIHTGSRNLGKQVAEHYQDLAYKLARGADKLIKAQQKLIDTYKAQGRRVEIQSALKELRQQFNYGVTETPKDLCYLTDEYREQYLHDMQICQEFATLNRETIAELIIKNYLGDGYSLADFKYFHTMHNYLDLDNNIIRKGAVSATLGEKLLIPINMRDGSLLCVGKGNEDWNYSAPHGAGRLSSRNVAKETLSMDEYQTEMRGIYSTCINENTLDESPMAYKDMSEIVSGIEPTAEIIKHIKPIYNFKADGR